MGTGRAYGFFDCTAKNEEIKAVLPTVRDLAQNPSKLELSLSEGVGHSYGLVNRAEANINQDILSIAQEAEQAGISHLMRASLPNASNRETAEELSAVLNQTYQSLLYQEGEDFRGETFFEENGQYVEQD